jgi:hypothetical protein
MAHQPGYGVQSFTEIAIVIIIVTLVTVCRLENFKEEIPLADAFLIYNRPSVMQPFFVIFYSHRISEFFLNILGANCDF